MRKPRSLSGIFFRFQNPETNKWENWCFEDLPESEQDRILAKAEPEFVKSLAKLLSKTVQDLGDNFDILTE